MPSRRRRTLPPVSPKVSAELRPLVAAIAEIIETGEGVRGDPLDRKLTIRDLVDGGVIKINTPVRSGGDVVVTPGGGDPDSTVPPTPSGFNATGGFDGRISLTWDIPGTLYDNHAYTNIYRAEEDNFANATLRGQEGGSFYTDVVRDDTTIKTYYYWIRFVSRADVEGPLNDPAGTPARALDDPAYIISKIEGQISESELAGELLTPIQAIPGMQSDLASHDDRISLVAAGVDDNVAAIQTKASATAVQDIEQDITVLSAQYTVKLDVNGYVSGIGISNDGTGSEFIVASDAVYFVDPGQSITPFNPGTNYASIDDLRDTQLVFGYAEVEGFKRFVINVPAYIPEGYIESGMVGAISFGKITTDTGVPVTTVSGKLKADYVDVDNLSVAEAATFFGDAQSGNFSAGNSGWRLQQSGTVEFYNGTFRGRIEANTGYISQNLQIGGTSQDVGDVLQMAQDADAGLSIVDSWKKPGYTLIDGNKIFTGDAYVDTLQIKGNAVTLLQAQTGGSRTGITNWVDVISFTYYHETSGNIDALVTWGGEVQGGTAGEADGNGFLRLVVAGVVRGSGSKQGTRYRTVGASTKLSFPNTGVSIKVQYSGNAGDSACRNVFATALGVKR